jgi:UDP-glucose 4-epimerase
VHVVVFGATGNVGSSLVRVLAEEPQVDSILGVARRLPDLDLPKTEWAEADVVGDELVPFVRGADVVVHLAWLIQPSRDLELLWHANVEGSSRVFEAVAAAGVPALVYASSSGAYSPGPKHRLVNEGYPTGGVHSSFYSRHKAEVERRLDLFEREHPEVRVVRLRPGLIFKREAAAAIRRLFAGPLLPGSLLRPGLVPVFPDVSGLRFQAVHSFDVAEAYRLAILGDVRGAFNVAAEPILDSQRLAQLLGARVVHVPSGFARGAVSLLWRLHLQPTSPGWLDLARSVPLVDTTRARTELGWTPRFTAEQAFRELLEGLRDGAGDATPPLAPRSGDPLRAHEPASGVGSRSGH